MMAVVRVSWITAALVTAYPVIPAPNMPDTEAALTTLGPRSEFSR